MGWLELEENQVAPHNMSETIADCISTLAQKRKDLWNTAETWGEVCNYLIGSFRLRTRLLLEHCEIAWNENTQQRCQLRET